MTLPDLFRLSYTSIVRTRGRAIMTMLGIVIGIASVILMLAIGKAAENYLLSQIASFGSDVVFIGNGSGDQEENGPPSNSVKQSLTIEDFRALERAPWVKAVSAMVISKDLLSAGGENVFAQVEGTTIGELTVFGGRAATGRFILPEDVDSRAKVVVLGAGIARQLFANNPPIGSLVKINKQNFRVVGVMEPGGTRFFTKVDDQVYIPVTTHLALYNKDRVNFISLKPKGIGPTQAKEEIRLILRDTHRLDNPNGLLSKDDFQVSSQEDAARSAGVIGMILQILLASVAAISLVVGGIGIMNIMLVTVTERTQEIGLRKSLGARRQDILGQFLLEAITLTFLGGVIGILVGLGLSYLIIRIIGSFQAGWIFTFPTTAIILATVVSTSIGIIFGYYPARKAAKLRPIEALRYE
ncbi:ABC transporter permease [Patescibacteria group bacterium]|nr:ABC transporter permease [Patescibacteria group bacterium]